LNIELLTLSEVTAVSGSKGNFTVSVKKHPRYVDTDKCIACNTCMQTLETGKAWLNWDKDVVNLVNLVSDNLA